MVDLGIALFTYRRPEHTKKVLDSLKKNHIKKLYIFQDGLRDEKDREEWLKVSELIRRVDFTEVEVHISNTNRGLASSIISGLDYVFSKHDAAIALEDDMYVSSQYLSFMTACLKKYKNNDKVSCIAGNAWSIEVPAHYSYDAFFSYRMSSNAWGTWKNRWQQYKRDYTLLAQIMRDKEKKAILDKSGDDILSIMRAQIEGTADSWAIFWVLMQINNKQVCVLPARHLAADIGHDGTGTNSATHFSRYDSAIWEGNVKEWRLPDQVIIDPDIIERLRITLHNPIAEIRLGAYDLIEKKWIECLQNECSFANYFLQRDICSAYIYGTSDICRLLFNQLKNILEIKGFLVLDKTCDTFCGQNVYELSDNVVLCNENIIVTPTHDWDYIIYSVTHRFGKQNFIHLQKMLNEIACSSLVPL